MKTGHASKFAITRLAAKYNEMASDGVVLSNRKTIDLIDFRIQKLLERVDVEEAPERIKDLYEKWEELKSCVPGMPGYLEKKAEIDVIFDRIYHDYEAWRQIFEAVDLRGKQTEREIKALTQIKAIMTAEDGYQLAAKLLAASMRVIGDNPLKLKELQFEYSRVIGESGDDNREGIGEDDWGGSEETGGEARSGDMDQAELLHTRDQE